MNFQTPDQQPTEEEAHACFLEILRHSFHVEYYWRELRIGRRDSQRPHDVAGGHNKFEWPVFKGLALQYRKKDLAWFEAHVLPSIVLHRQQYHHQMWNTFNPLANSEDLCCGAVDAVCSLLEPRGYQGGSHSFDWIRQYALGIKDETEHHKREWMVRMAHEMEAVKQPALSVIQSLDNVPNIGVSEGAYDLTLRCLSSALTRVRQYQGYTLDMVARDRRKPVTIH